MFEVLHLIPGRARLRFEAVKGRPEFAQRLRTHLQAVSRIEGVTVNTRTGSVLLLYDTRALRSPAFLDEVSESLGGLFPGHFAPGRLQITLRRLKGQSELARALEKHLAPIRGINRIAIDPTSGNCQLAYDSQAVTSPDFLDALTDVLAACLPRANPKKLLARAGFPLR